MFADSDPSPTEPLDPARPRFPYRSDHLGAEELQATHSNPQALALRANRIAGLRGLPHRAIVLQRADGIIEFCVRDGSGAEHLKSWTEFAVSVFDNLEMLKRERSGLIDEIWFDVCEALDSEYPELAEPIKHEVRAHLIAHLDDFDLAGAQTILSWGKSLARQVVAHRLRIESDASKPLYPDDGTGNKRAALTLESHQANEPLTQLGHVDYAERGTALFEKRRQDIKKLRPKQRTVVELRVVKGLEFHEIAEKLAINLQTVYSRFKSGLSNLDKMIPPEDRAIAHDLFSDNYVVTVSHTGTSGIIRDPRGKFASLRKLDFNKHVASLSAEEQRRIRDAEAEYVGNRAVRLSQLERNIADCSGDESDADQASSQHQHGGAIADRTDSLQITRLRGAKLADAEIDQGTLPLKRGIL
jgi:RNA polymerase sigma factor (sigma-70 family)